MLTILHYLRLIIGTYKENEMSEKFIKYAKYLRKPSAMVKLSKSLCKQLKGCFLGKF